MPRKEEAADDGDLDLGIQNGREKTNWPLTRGWQFDLHDL